MAISASETQSSTAMLVEVESVKCHSCGFTEDCTAAYISRVRDRYQGRWICGLCAEAVKDEVLRSDTLISVEEALNRHISFFNKFKSSTPLNQTDHPISAIGRILRRTLDNSPRAVRSNSTIIFPTVEKINGSSSLTRSESCISSLSR